MNLCLTILHNYNVIIVGINIVDHMIYIPQNNKVNNIPCEDGLSHKSCS